MDVNSFLKHCPNPIYSSTGGNSIKLFSWGCLFTSLLLVLSTSDGSVHRPNSDQIISKPLFLNLRLKALILGFPSLFQDYIIAFRPPAVKQPKFKVAKYSSIKDSETMNLLNYTSFVVDAAIANKPWTWSFECVKWFMWTGTPRKTVLLQSYFSCFLQSGTSNTGCNH